MLTYKSITQGGQKDSLIFWNKTHWGKTITASIFTKHIVPQMHTFWQEQSQLQLDSVNLQQENTSPGHAVYTQNQLKHLASGATSTLLTGPFYDQTAAQ